MSGDDGGMGKNDSPDGRLGLGGSVTCICPFVPSFFGRLVLESVASTAEGVRPDLFSLMGVAQCRR
jgi:hypothetical protein